MNAPARWLFALGRALMPHSRRAWIDAMRAEADYLPAHGATRWASGCLYAAIQERLHMNTGDFRISRWVMLVETLGCFGFMTLGWFVVTFGYSGLLRRDWDVVTKNYLPYPGGAFIFSMIALGAIVGLVGPVGLYLGGRYFLTGRGLANRKLAGVLIAAPLVYVVASMAGYFVGPPDWHSNLALGVMCVLLPVVGIAHLAWLAGPVAPAPPQVVAGLAGS
jgi:hypothetical protein